MKKIDFENGKISNNILAAVLPMMAAQIVNLLYNIVDRIYISRIPEVGTAALGGVGLCFPIIMMVAAFSNLFGIGGAPLFSIQLGKGDSANAGKIMNLSFSMLTACGAVLTACGLVFATPLLRLFGASDNSLTYAYPYLMIYMLGTIPTMYSTGLNPYINAQGYSLVGMITVAVGAVLNIALDPLFIFAFNMGVQGAAIATVISQVISGAFVITFLKNKAAIKLKFAKLKEFRANLSTVKNIIGLGTVGFIMQVTNSLVSITCNSVLSHVGGDIWVSVMTVVSSIRQILDTPLHAISEGSTPVISYNYGARRPEKVKQAIKMMSILIMTYAITMWLIILIFPRILVSIFTSDAALIDLAAPALRLYFIAFIFQFLMYVGQTVFKALNKKKYAITFSLLRKAVIVVPATYIFTYAFDMGVNGVFIAEPVSNFLVGTTCFICMLKIVMLELKAMEDNDSRQS